MNCLNRTQLQLYIDHEMNSDDRQKCVDHLMTCLLCTRRLEELNLKKMKMKDSFEQLDKGLMEGVKAPLIPAGLSLKRNRNWSSWIHAKVAIPVPLVMVLLLLIIGLGVGYLWQKGENPNMKMINNPQIARKLPTEQAVQKIWIDVDLKKYRAKNEANIYLIEEEHL